MTKQELIIELLRTHRYFTQRAQKSWNGLIALNLCHTFNNMDRATLLNLLGSFQKLKTGSNAIRHAIGIDASELAKKVGVQ